MAKEFLTVNEVSEITGLHPNTIRKRIKDGVFETLPRGKNEKVLIKGESIYGRNSKEV